MAPACCFNDKMRNDSIMKNILLTLWFMAVALSVYNCGYKGPLYMPHNNEPVTAVNKEASKPKALVNNESTALVSNKLSASMAGKNSIKMKQNESSIKINFRSKLNESN